MTTKTETLGELLGNVAVDFEFFGVKVRAENLSVPDRDHLLEHFREYLIAFDSANSPDYCLSFEHSSDESSFKDALMNPSAVKAINIRSKNEDWKVWDRWTRRSLLPSPLPPFSLPPLNSEYRLLHAAAVANSAGDATVISGSSGAGKSTLGIALSMRGATFISDDTLPIDSDNRAWPFLRPINIRRQTFALVPGLERATRPGSVRYPRRSGTTTICHPRHLPITIATRPCPVVRVIELADTSAPRKIATTDYGLRISGDWSDCYSTLVDRVWKEINA